MTAALFVISTFTSLVFATQEAAWAVQAAKAVHHHFSRPAYHHVIKPVGKPLVQMVTLK